MGTFAQFAAVNTKIKALQRDLLKEDDYRRMLDARNVEEVVQYLKENTAYGALLEDIDTGPVQINKLEVVFRTHILKRYETLIHYLTEKYRILFRIIFMRYEVENLKLIIRAVTRKEDLAPLVDSFYQSSVIPQLDYKQLTMAKTFEEVIHHLQNTRYHKVLAPYAGESPDRLLFYVEMSLDRMYFKTLAVATSKIEPEDESLVTELLGKNTDILNIQWIYRGQKFYHISSEELFNYSLPTGAQLDLKSLRKLCYAADEGDLIEKLKKTPYAFLFQEDENFERFMEIRMERYLFSLLKKMDKKSFMTFLPTVIYIHRLEFEMRDIFSILEAKKFNLSFEDIKQFLVRPLAG